MPTVVGPLSRRVYGAASLHIEYPMLFKVENRKTGRSTHCGVLEFIADEGHVYLPYWVRRLAWLCSSVLSLKQTVHMPTGNAADDAKFGNGGRRNS